MRRWGILAGVVALATALVLPAPSAGAADLNNVTVKLQSVATKSKFPLAIAFRAGDNVMYVAEQNSGKVRYIVNGKPAKGKVLKVAISKGGERGLLGMVFSPNGQKLYVDYTDKNGDIIVDQYTMSGRTAVKSTRRQILFQEHSQYGNHNGGQLLFGPDGYLYIWIGDGGFGGDPYNNAENLGTRLGKILRIDVGPNPFAPYAVPADNPFRNTPGARPEIWMYGLRNPWRSSFDRLTGDLWIGDVGQQAYEEINYAPAGMKGTNWGWRLREGFHQYLGPQPPGGRDPIIERPHDPDGDCAIIGGYVYRGTRNPNLYGAYVYADICTGIVRAAVQSGGVVTQQKVLLTTAQGISSFGEDPSGELYAITRGGTIYKLVP